MIVDLTKMSISNASLLDEATAAAEAMTMCSAIARGKKTKFLVSVGERSCLLLSSTAPCAALPFIHKGQVHDQWSGLQGICSCLN